MLWGGLAGELEVRKRASGAMALRGRFPYNTSAVLSDGGRTGRPRKERIASRAFAYRIERPKEEIHLLTGHDFNRPLASRAAGTLDIEDGDDAVTFTATIAPEMAEVTHVRDTLAAISAGLMIGISPGFRIPPERAVPDAETITEEGDNPEKGEHRAIIRTINAALVYEFSVVARPAYPEAQISARSWDLTTAPTPRPIPAITRWR